LLNLPCSSVLHFYAEMFAWLAQISGDLTTEALRARSKEFLIKKYSDLCELCVSAVKYGLLLWLRPCRAVPQELF
jgi:hypothetical protein